MGLSQIRGALLEELVLHLLEKVGYRNVLAFEEGTEQNSAGLVVRGRGEEHQIDGLAAFDYTPPFMYPLRLLVEAKCYAEKRPIGIGVVRNAVGVLKDISENYFTLQKDGNGTKIQAPRFNYHSALFSTSGYTENAQRFAIAHQIFLIQYENIHWFKPVVEGLLSLNETHLSDVEQADGTGLHQFRMHIRYMLQEAGMTFQGQLLTAGGFQHIHDKIITPLLDIKGSYFGMLNGRWPVHLLSNKLLPPAAFAHTDELKCKIHGKYSSSWAFVPSEFSEGDERYFRLQFDLPSEILKMLAHVKDDGLQVADIKEEYFSDLYLSGIIGGIRRQIKLSLDTEWLLKYRERYEG